MPRAVSGSSSATRDVTPIRVRDAPAHNLTDPCDPNIAANETNDE
jgi:hypothetical protein